MSVDITPMNLSDIFNRTFNLIGKTALRNLIIAVVVIAPVVLILGIAVNMFFGGLADVLTKSDFEDIRIWEMLSNFLGAGLLFILSLILLALGSIIVQVAVTIVVCTEMEEDEITWSEALTRAFGVRGWKAVGQQILYSLAIMALVVIPYVMIIIGAVSDSDTVIGMGVLGFLVIIPVSIFLAIRWLFALQVIAWEDTGVIEGFKRSWFLVENNWWRVLGIVILLSIVAQFAISIIVTPLFFVAMWGIISQYFHMMMNGADTMTPGQVAGMLKSLGWGYGLVIGVSEILSLVVTPVYLAVMYFDLRARKGEFESPHTADVGDAIDLDNIAPTGG
ncbi:MAG: hypothetical protein GXO82_10425 [Chlorobi bacterium]|nr:hypothetical protein [Chlorobiota bacterium]